MITGEMLAPIGHTGKPHGINGELNLFVNDRFLDSDISLDDLRCIVMDVDGIFVPFFIGKLRAKGFDNLLVKIDGIDNEKDAKELASKTVYALTDEYNPSSTQNGKDGLYAEDLIGFAVNDEGKHLGVIEDIDDSTDNALFIISRVDSDKPLYIPIADDFIDNIDIEKKIISMSLPQGMTDL